MERWLRFVIGALALSFVCHGAYSQQPAGKLSRIAFLGSGSAASMAKPLDALREGLLGLGFVEGKNLAIEYRWAEGRFERLPSLAAELLRLKPELIIVWGTPATVAAQKATSTVPIVMCNTGDPDETGIVASLARPGGNVTGVANLGGSVVQKQVELLVQTIPGISRIAVLRNPGNTSLVPQQRGAETAARSLGLQLQILDVRGPGDLDAAFARMVTGKAAGVLVLADPLFLDQGKRIAELAEKRKLPTVSARSEIAVLGIMLTYGASTVEQFRSAAVYVSKILMGAKPADLPVEQAAKFELVVNLQTAKKIGVVVPQSVLTRADRVIE